MSSSSQSKVRSGPAAYEFVSRIEDPLQHILACHEQIERRLVTLQNAAMMVGFSEGAMLQDAAAALAYEVEVLQAIDTLHTEDEEASLFPRLRANLRHDVSVLGPLMLSLELQHQNEQVAFTRLRVAVKAIVASGAQPSDQASSCEDLVRELAGVCGPHMALENDSLLPLARKALTPADLAALTKEMRQRWGL
ncbi:MAG: hemerythrin domain-containing protein [Acidobacteria bacterium]|nr:hemerythrin domain-containing protein [Acidobacteriota bacterium]